jgi:hypothetical protein
MRSHFVRLIRQGSSIIRSTAETLLPAEHIAEILDRCWKLEQQSDIGMLLRLFVIEP